MQLWRKLERTRRLLGGQYKRFCIRNVLKAWFGYEATSDFIWEVCHLAAVDDEPQEGWNELPVPSLYPRKHRELLRAIVAVRLGISYWKINLKALDKAYSGAHDARGVDLGGKGREAEQNVLPLNFLFLMLLTISMRLNRECPQQ